MNALVASPDADATTLVACNHERRVGPCDRRHFSAAVFALLVDERAGHHVPELHAAFLATAEQPQLATALCEHTKRSHALVSARALQVRVKAETRIGFDLHTHYHSQHLAAEAEPGHQRGTHLVDEHAVLCGKRCEYATVGRDAQIAYLSGTMGDK